MVLEKPRKGSVVESAFCPEADSFVLVERTTSGRLVFHKNWDAMAVIGQAGVVREFVLRNGAAWSSRTSLALS